MSDTEYLAVPHFLRKEEPTPSIKEMDDKFESLVGRSALYERFQIYCLRGLWAVDFEIEKQAIADAKYLFRKHYIKGDYSELS